MQDGILVGIDAGTSVIKPVAYTADGTQVAVPNNYVTKAEGRTRMINGTIEKMALYGCAGKAKAA